jgi:arylsulfatase A-like enzyme
VYKRQAFLAEYFMERGYPNTPTLVAVRTESAKLIRYPGHEEWTELFDLATDPYETKNLINDPEHEKLKNQLSEEFDRQVKLTSFVIPDYADKPEETPGQPAPKKSKRAKKQR